MLSGDKNRSTEMGDKIHMRTHIHLYIHTHFTRPRKNNDYLLVQPLYGVKYSLILVLLHQPQAVNIT